MATRAKQDASVTKWLAAKEKVDKSAKPLVEEERALRKLVIAKFFPRPRENTNLADCGTGALSLQQPYKRTIDEASLDANMNSLVQAGIPMDDIIVYVPKLNMEEYRKLTVAQRKKLDRCMTITLDSPSLSYIPDPKPQKA